MKLNEVKNLGDLNQLRVLGAAESRERKTADFY